MSIGWEKHLCFTQHEHVKVMCQPLLGLGIEHFFYMRIYEDNTFVDLSTDLAWTTYYFTKYFSEQYDSLSVSNHSFIEHRVSIWSMNSHNQIWVDGFEHFNIKDGLSITLQRKGYRDIFSFYVTNQNKLTTEGLINRIDLLQVFCEYFLEKAARMIRSSRDGTLTIPRKYQIQNTCHAVAPTGNFLDFCNFADFEKLCDQERRCIHYAGQGLGSEIIGKKLCISKRTVESYIMSARKKTHCKNITELATKYHYFKLMY